VFPSTGCSTLLLTLVLFAVCGAGKYSAAGAASCTACGAGYDSPAGAFSCLEVGAVFLWQDSSTCALPITSAKECAEAAEYLHKSWSSSSVDDPRFWPSCVDFGGTVYFTGNHTYWDHYTGRCSAGAPCICKKPVCTAGTYWNAEASSCSDCSAGFYSEAAGSSFCLRCSPGYYSSGGSSSCTGCNPGYYAANASQCTKCNPGQISAAHSTSCSACPIGKLLIWTSSKSSSTNLTTSDTAHCYNCPAGMVYSTVNGSAFCKVCSSGRISNETGSTSCSVCSPGRYGLAGFSSCSECPAGKMSPSSTASTCEACEAGHYSTAGASSCTACRAGTFATRIGASSCTDCPAGYALTTGLQHLDWEKVPFKRCTYRTSSPAAYNSLEKAQSACSASGTCYGVYDQGCDNRGSLHLCEAGGLYKAMSSSSCVYEKPSAGNSNISVTTVTLQACKVGHYSPAGKAPCMECPVGKYSATIASAHCTDCPAGWAPAAWDSVYPILTPTPTNWASKYVWGNFYYQATSGASSCSKCPSGRYSESGSSSCLGCNAGSYFVPDVTKLTIGRPSSSSSSCLKCDAGRHSAAAGATTCAECPAGKNSLRGSSTCSTFAGCPAGHFQPSSPGKACKACKSGHYSVAGATACSECDAGQYQPDTGASSCSECAAGRYATRRVSPCGSLPQGYQCPAADVQSPYGASTCLACTPAGEAPQSTSSQVSCCPGLKLTTVHGQENCM